MIFVTGGLGYIGSHLVVELMKHSHKVVILDDLSNSRITVVEQIEKLTGVCPQVYFGDVRDKSILKHIFDNHKINVVIHLAGLKNVGESVTKPLDYYDVNVYGSIALLEMMKKYGCKKILFSSSTTVYGDRDPPYREEMPIEIAKITNPYGRSKAMVEQVLFDMHRFDPEWKIYILRYFNPIGAHPSGLIGEDPIKDTVNLFPAIIHQAYAQHSSKDHIDHKDQKDSSQKLKLFGDDYNTPDGTCIRDYIHIMDLVLAHILSVHKLIDTDKEEVEREIKVYNVGTGQGTTVKELIDCFIKTTGENVSYEIVGRRVGDLPATYADVQKINQEIGWIAQLTKEDACRDGWHYMTIKSRC